ncbi:MAG: carboxypeptidase regulatory-like domain-containing protein, partial [Chloroflexi bacterium]|nr:carboxypeptidase regulatory-like domain-containing protein [Chloroflexota bacterium]
LYPLQNTGQLAPGESHTLPADLPAVLGDIHGFVRAGDVAGQTRIGTARRNASTSSITDTYEGFPYLPVQLPGARVTVTSARFGGMSFSPPATTVTSDKQGNFVLQLPPGGYSVQVTAPGHATFTTEVTIGSAPLARDFRLSPATTSVVGRIDGTMIQDMTHLTDAVFGVSGASVVLQRGDLVFAAETDERGVFVIEGLPLDIEDGVISDTDYELRVTHTEYFPLTQVLTLTSAEGVHRLVREFPALAAGGFLEISIAVTDKNGNKSAAIGTLESIQNLRTMDVYDASFLSGAESVEIPNLISIRARPGRYRARICPGTPGLQGCFDHFWTSSGGVIDTLDLSFNCGDGPRLVRCSLDGGISAGPAGHIQASGYIYSASTGEPLPQARVTVALNVVTEYCAETCSGFVREFSATGPTSPSGRYQIEFQIPASNGGADLTGWSWDGGDRTITVTSAGYETIVDTGPGGPVRSFDGSQDYYLTPSGRLNTLIVASAAEGPPVSGLDAGLGVPVTGQDRRATVTLSPLGADLATGSDGVVSFRAPPGITEVIVNAPGHYPYTASVLVPDASGDSIVDARFTLAIEQIPPPLIVPESFAITQRADGLPLKGYVLRGLSSPATNTLWEVRVNRDGVRPLRPGFNDPVESVDLVINVAEACPGTPIQGGALHLRGTLLSGSVSGTGTWGGNLDVADLPCGVLQWRVDARTSRSIVTLGFDWPLWPSGQRYPLSILTGMAGTPVAPASDALVTAAGSTLTFEAQPGSLQIKRNGEYLLYELPDIVVTSNFGPPKAGKLLGELSGTTPVFGQVQAVLSIATLNGETGLFDFRSLTSGPTPPDEGAVNYTVTAEGLFSLDSAAVPSASGAGIWGESISAALGETRSETIDLRLLPNPLWSPLNRLASGGDAGSIQGTVFERVSTDASWNLSPPPPPGATPPITGERNVVAGARFEIVSITEFEFGTSVMSHLKVDGRLDSRAVAAFAEVAGSGSVREARATASGGLTISSELWSVWNSGREIPDFTFFDRDPGTESIAHTALIVGEPRWVEGAAGAFTGPRPGDSAEVLGAGGLARPAISATRDTDGALFVSFVTANPGSGRPGSGGVSLLRAGSNGGEWSPPILVDVLPQGMSVDTAITSGADGEAMLVWSAIPDIGDDPRAFVRSASTAELFYSLMDAATGTWSTPQAITDDNRPDFAPVIASDGAGRFVVAWARDMDGNLLTAGDIVVYASEWVSGRWSAPSPVMHAPGAISELSVSAAPGTAVVGVIANAPDTGRSVILSFNSLGRWSPVNVVASGRAGLSDVAVLMDRPGLATVAWNESVPGSSWRGRITHRRRGSHLSRDSRRGDRCGRRPPFRRSVSCPDGRGPAPGVGRRRGSDRVRQPPGTERVVCCFYYRHHIWPVVEVRGDSGGSAGHGSDLPRDGKRRRPRTRLRGVTGPLGGVHRPGVRSPSAQRWPQHIAKSPHRTSEAQAEQPHAEQSVLAADQVRASKRNVTSKDRRSALLRCAGGMLRQLVLGRIQRQLFSLTIKHRVAAGFNCVRDIH